MARVALVHWKATETAPRVQALRDAGHSASAITTDDGPEGLRALRTAPPDVVVIDLSRLPSHGREVATALRQQKSTRHVPLVFVEGQTEKVAMIRALLPDATYCSWKKIDVAIKQALHKPPRDPVVPDMMERYKRTPLPKKLGIRAGMGVLRIGGPAALDEAISAFAPDVRMLGRAAKNADLILLFAPDRAALANRLTPLCRRLAEGGSIWICWPKRASDVTTDLTDSAVREIGISSGLVDFKVCAIDETWSGLRFARRAEKVKNR
ncbi:MAG: hypothetical protein U1D55_04240 [Phycisphaerae bacterium]